MDLKQRFYELTSSYNFSNSELLWKEIEQKYTEKHRFYHNLKHLKEIFHYFDTYKLKIEHPDKVTFAIFYHDIIYNIFSTKNEVKSAIIAKKRLQNIVATETIVEHIIATKTHEGTTNDNKYMIDFDLAILGQTSEVYKKYTQRIRKEYRLIPELIYTKGRKKVLNHFLNKSSIYKTSEFIELYEKKARKNLRTELENLKNGIK